MARTKARNLALFGAGMSLLVLVAAVSAAVLMVMTANRSGTDKAASIDEHCEATVGEYSGSLEVDQADNAALIATIARSRGLPGRAVTIALATAMQESGIRNLDYGDRDSLGMFQQRPSQGWGSEAQVQDPAYATGAFFDELVKIADYQQMPITVAAQAVQRSAYPDAYGKHESMARSFASALTGTAPASLTCILKPAEPGAKPEPLRQALKAAFPAAQVQTSTGPLGEATLQINAAPGRTADSAHTWALAHWLVIEAQRFGITEVQVGNKLWQRDLGTWELSTREPVPAGQIRVTLSAPGPSPTATP